MKRGLQDRVHELLELESKGYKAHKIAKELGLKTTTVRDTLTLYHLREADIAKGVDDKVILDKFNSGESLLEILSETMLSIDYIVDRLKKNGVEVKVQVDDKMEQIIETLYNTGLSFVQMGYITGLTDGIVRDALIRSGKHKPDIEKRDIDEEKIIELYVKKRMGIPKIMKLTGDSHIQVRHILYKNRVNMKGANYISNEVLDTYKEHYLNGKSVKEIADMYEVLESSMLTNLKIAGVVPINYKLSKEQIDTICDMYKSGKSLYAINKETEIGIEQIRSILMKDGIFRGTNLKRVHLTEDNKKLITEMVECNKSPKDIASKIGVSYMTALKIIKKMGFNEYLNNRKKCTSSEWRKEHGVKHFNELLSRHSAVDMYKMVLSGSLKKLPDGFWTYDGYKDRVTECTKYLLEEILKWDRQDICERLNNSVLVKNGLYAVLLKNDNDFFNVVDMVYPNQFSRDEFKWNKKKTLK